MQKTVDVNEAGLRIGEDHPNVKLTDGEVETKRGPRAWLDGVTLAAAYCWSTRPRRAQVPCQGLPPPRKRCRVARMTRATLEGRP